MKYEAWSNAGNAPAEVQAYIDKLEASEDEKVIFVDGMTYGTPDGECHSESWTVVSEYHIGGIVIKRFLYHYNAEMAAELDYTSDAIIAATDLLKIAKALLEDDGHRMFWEYINKTEEVA